MDKNETALTCELFFVHDRGNNVDKLKVLIITEKIKPWDWLSFYIKNCCCFLFCFALLLVDFPVLKFFNFSLFVLVLRDTQTLKKIYLPVLYVSFWIFYLWRNKTYLLSSFDNYRFYLSQVTLKANLIWRYCSNWSKFDVLLEYKVLKNFV